LKAAHAKEILLKMVETCRSIKKQIRLLCEMSVLNFTHVDPNIAGRKMHSKFVLIASEQAHFYSHCSTI